MSLAVRHSRIHERQMLDWLRQREDERAIPPSYEEIAEAFAFETVESARTLIAELSDRGFIRVKPAGPGRFSCKIITLTEKPRTLSVVRTNRDVAEVEDEGQPSGADRWREAHKRVLERQAEAPTAEPIEAKVDIEVNAEPPEDDLPPDTEEESSRWATFPCGHDQRPSNSQRAGRGRTICRQCWRKKYDAGRPPRKDVKPPRAAYASKSPNEITFTVHGRTTAWLQSHLPMEAGVETKEEFARALFMEGLSKRLEYRGSTKPIIRGTVLRAWQIYAPEKTLGEFVTGLIDAGLESMEGAK